MQQFGNKRYEWLKTTPLLQLEDIIVPLAAGGGMLYAPAGGLLYLTWGVESNQRLDFMVEGCVNVGFLAAETFVLVNQACLAATYYTPYQMPAPFTGGHITITMPYIRIRLRETVNIDHTLTRVYVKGWWP